MNPGRQNALLLVALLVAQLILMSSSVHQEDGSTSLERNLVRLSQPFLSVGRMASGSVKGVIKGVHDFRVFKSENERLAREVSELRSELNRYRSDALENSRLRRLLGMKDYLAPQSVGATVVMANLSGQERVITVDRGAKEGILVDQPVVAWGGAVGRVVRTTGGYAWVRLLADPNSGVAGIVQRSRVEGMVLGRGESVLEMAYVAGFADVVLGDRVVTSGLDGVFPKGFGIGRVVHVDESSGISKSIQVKSDVDFSALEEVLILTGSGSSNQEREDGP